MFVALPYFCGHGYRIKCRKRGSPGVQDYDVGHFLGNPVVAGRHRYVENALAFRSDPCVGRSRHHMDKFYSGLADKHP